MIMYPGITYPVILVEFLVNLGFSGFLIAMKVRGFMLESQ